MPRVRMPLGGGCPVVGCHVVESPVLGCHLAVDATLWDTTCWNATCRDVPPIPVDNSDDIGILDSGETVGNRYHTPALGRKQKHIINKIRQNGIIHNQLAYNFSTPVKIDRMNV